MFKFMFDCVNSDSCELPKNEIIHQIKDLFSLLKQLMLKLDQELMHHVLFALRNINELVFNYKVKELKEIHANYCNMLKEIVFQQCHQVVANSWRYYLTWIKLVSSIIQFQNVKIRPIQNLAMQKLFGLVKGPNDKKLSKPVLKEIIYQLA